MDDQNPYTPPKSELADNQPAPPELELADRGIRLLAAIIDSLIVMIVFAPVLWFAGFFKSIMANEVDFMFSLKVTLAGFLVYVLVQGFPLFYWGQTWAKRLVDIRIVDMEGRQPEFWKLIVLRYGVIQAIGLIPVLGGLFGLANPLFIFGEERRCLHDRIAGTRVINVNKR